MTSNYKVISTFIAILLFWITFVGCAQGNDKSKPLPSVHFVVSYSFPSVNDLAFRLRDTFHIYHYDTYVVYAMPHKTVTQKSENVTDTVSDNSFFVYKKNGKFGFELRSLHDTVGKVRTDRATYLKERAFASINFPADRSNYDSLVKSYKDADVLVEQYFVKKAMYGQYFDTTYYSYSKNMDSVPYTFSPALDSAHGMKLYKARFILSPRRQDNVSYPLREYSYELINVERNESIEKSIKLFIDKFKNMLAAD